MSIIIKDEATGDDKEVFTKEELELKAKEVEEQYQKQLAEKDEHHKKKLDEFMQGKKGVEEKEKEVEGKQKEWEMKIEETKKSAEEAKAIAASERAARFDAIKNHLFDQYGGNDPEVKKKLEEKWELINVPITNDDDVKRRAQLTAELAGLNTSGSNQNQFNGVASFGGGYAPAFNKKEGVSNEEYSKFKSELGLDDIGVTDSK